MNKAQKAVIIFFAVAIIAIASLSVIYIKAKGHATNENLPEGTILYYSETCPHCKIVEQFITDNNITSKINITQKEAFANKTNGGELVLVENYCKVPEEYIGSVPLLFSNNACYLGDKEITDFLKNQTGAA